MIKPFLKWPGGKTQILNKINFPKQINNYCEPFLGGGSVLLHLLTFIENRNVFITGSINASDSNELLINCYQTIKHSPSLLCEILYYLKNIYSSANILNHPNKKRKIELKTIDELAAPLSNWDYIFSELFNLDQESIYYQCRKLYNKSLIISNDKNKNVIMAALFIFLNKTGFRGMYRESKNGFNVSFGHYKNPKIYNSNQIFQLHQLFNKWNVHFEVKDFEQIIVTPFQDISNFYYLDPPYFPIKENSFVQYNKMGFDKSKHQKIFELCFLIHESKSLFLLSNSNTLIINNLFKDFYIITLTCKRRIHNKNPNALEEEVLISNFK